MVVGLVLLEFLSLAFQIEISDAGVLFRGLEVKESWT
jgi:hypothetical protein